jgi:IS5 family transposase
MKQSDLGLKLSTKRTRKREFLDEMQRVVPWAELIALIEPHYPKGKTGRPPMGIATMLRIHFLQQWFGLSDPAMEEALHDVPLYREFADLEGPMRRLPDESTILRFRHLLEEHGLAAPMFATVNRVLQAHGLTLKTGTVVDATLIAAPSSTKNSTGERDPGDAPDEEGQQLLLRHEGAHRRRCRLGPGAHRDLHARQHQRRDASRGAAARRGRDRLRRCRLPGRAQEARSDDEELARRNAPGQAAQARSVK